MDYDCACEYTMRMHGGLGCRGLYICAGNCGPCTYILLLNIAVIKRTKQKDGTNCVTVRRGLADELCRELLVNMCLYYLYVLANYEKEKWIQF